MALKFLDSYVIGFSCEQQGFSPAPSSYNYNISLQERTFRLTGTEVNVEGCDVLEHVMSKILKAIDHFEVAPFSIDSWIRLHRIPSGKNIDLPTWNNFQAWLNGDNTKFEFEFDYYLHHNDLPKLVNTKFKLWEKFLNEEIKPRLYDVFHPIHAVLAGPVYYQLSLW